MNHVITPLACWVLCELSCLLHELGHAAGDRMGGSRALWRIIVGSGPKLLELGRIRFRLIPVGGYYLPESGEDPAKGMIPMLAGGPTASLLLTLLFGALRFFVFTSAGAENSLLDLRELSSFVFLWNLFQFLFTAIPMRYRVVCPGLDSDGRQILTLLRERKDDKKAQ